MSDVVFLGTSNVVPGTWPETLGGWMGWTVHNYAVSGGGFTASGAAKFSAQAAVAVGDKSYDHLGVTHVFVADMGNDIRATWAVGGEAGPVFAELRQEFPNARLILLPCLWGNCPAQPDGSGNNIGGRIASITMRVAEAVNAGLPYGVELIPYSWTWMADSYGTGWMLPGQVHYTPAGYQRVAQFVRAYLEGGSVCYDVPWYLIQPKAAVVANSAYWRASREGNTVHLENTFTLSAAVGLDTELGQLSYGTWPIDTVYAVAVNASDRKPYTIAIFPNGLIRSFGAMPAGTYILAVTFRAF